MVPHAQRNVENKYRSGKKKKKREKKVFYKNRQEMGGKGYEHGIIIVRTQGKFILGTEL